MPTWRDVVEFPQGKIVDLVRERLLVLPQDPGLYSGSIEQSRGKLANLISSSHYPIDVAVVADDQRKRTFFTAIAFFPEGFFGTFGMETSREAGSVDVNIGFHVQGKAFTPEGLHVLRYNNPHLMHSKRDTGAKGWHFDIVQENGEEVRLSSEENVTPAISVSDLFGEWYGLAKQARRLVSAPYYKWDEDFSLAESEEKRQDVSKALLQGMEKYPPFKQAIEIAAREPKRKM